MTNTVCAGNGLHFSLRMASELTRQKLISKLNGPCSGNYLNQEKKSMTLLEICIKPCHQHVQIRMSGYRFTPSLSPAFAKKILTELHVHLKHDKFDLEKIVVFFFMNSPKLALLVGCFLLKNIKREGDSK